MEPQMRVIIKNNKNDSSSNVMHSNALKKKLTLASLIFLYYIYLFSFYLLYN